MKLKHLLSNRKIAIVAIVLLVAICAGVILLMVGSGKGSQPSDKGILTEQEKDNTDFYGDESSSEVAEENQTDKDKNDSKPSDDKILKPNEIPAGHISDVSGTWEDIPETDQKNDSDKTDENTEGEEQEEILEDEITWGEIY